MSQEDFLDALVENLEPVQRARPWSRVLCIWCGFSGCLIAAVILTIGPLRDGILNEFLGSPRLILELAIGMLAGVAAIVVALELGVPGTPIPRRLWRAPPVLFALWAFVILAQLVHPASSGQGSNGMRTHCFLQTLSASLPSAMLAIYLLHGRILFETRRAGCLAGMAAAALPALWMEFSCMTSPMHALKFHLSPILLVGALTALLANLLVANDGFPSRLPRY